MEPVALKEVKIATEQRAAFFAVVTFALILTPPPIVELPLLALLAAAGALYVPRLGSAYTVTLFFLLFSLLATNAYLYLFQGYSISPYDATAECKMFSTFLVQALLYRRFLLKKAVYQSGRVLAFYNIFIPAIFVSTLIGTALGFSRDPLIFGFSINAAYAIVLLTAYLLESVSLKMLAVAIGAVGLLGSTTAAMLMALLISLRYKKHWFLAGVLLLICSVAVYVYSLEFRGKDFLNSDIAVFDRYQINMYIAKIIAANFDLTNYLLGWGIGRQLPQVDPGSYPTTADPLASP